MTIKLNDDKTIDLVSLLLHALLFDLNTQGVDCNRLASLANTLELARVTMSSAGKRSVVFLSSIPPGEENE